jgi:hypothetical protein
MHTRHHRDLWSSVYSLRESLGISADGSEKAFHTEAISHFIKRQAPEIIYDVRTPENNTSHFFVACDPSGGGASAFSVASIAQDRNGFMHVRFRPRPHPPLSHTHSLGSSLRATAQPAWP